MKLNRLDPFQLGPFKAGDKAECVCATIIEFVVVDDPVFLRGIGRKRPFKWWRGEDGSSHCYYEDDQKYLPVKDAWHQPMERIVEEEKQ